MAWTVLGLVVGAAFTAWQLLSGKSVRPLAAMGLSWLILEIYSTGNGLRRLPTFFRAASAACVGMLVLVCLASAVQGLAQAPWRYHSSTVITGRELLKIWLLSHGETIYPLPGGYPFLVTLYTPFFFVLGACLNRLLENPALTGMFLSAGPFMALSLLVFHWIRKARGSWTAALLAVALLLSSPSLTNAGALIRPDWLAWLLAYSGAFAALTGSPSRVRIALAATLLACAVLTKQQSVPVLVGVATVWITDHSLLRRTLAAGVLAGLLILGGVLLAQWLTGGGFLIHTLKYPLALSGNPDITNWNSAEPRLKDFAIWNLPVLLLWVASLAVNLYRRKVQWLDWILIVHIPFLIRLTMTWGADANYFWGFSIALYLRTGLIFSELLHRYAIMLPTLACFFILALNLPRVAIPFQDTGSVATYENDVEIINNHIRGNGPVLLTAEMSGYCLPREYTSRLQFFDGIETNFFEKAGFWTFSNSLLAKDIINRQFASIVIGVTFINPGLIDFLEYFYHRVYSCERFSIFAPEPGICILYKLPTDRPLEKDGLRTQISQIEGVHVNSGFGGFSFSRDETAAESFIEFSLQKNPGLETIHVVFHPKVASFGPGNEVLVEWSEEEGPFRPIFSSQGTPKDTSDRLGAFPATFSLSSASRTLRIKFSLKSTGQVWFSPEAPILFRVTPAEN